MNRQALSYVSPLATLLMAAFLAATQFQSLRTGIGFAPRTEMASYGAARVDSAGQGSAHAHEWAPGTDRFAARQTGLTADVGPRVALPALAGGAPLLRVPARLAQPRRTEIASMAGHQAAGRTFPVAGGAERTPLPEARPEPPLGGPADPATWPVVRRGGVQIATSVAPGLPDVDANRHMARFGTPVARRKTLRVGQ